MNRTVGIAIVAITLVVLSYIVITLPKESNQIEITDWNTFDNNQILFEYPKFWSQDPSIGALHVSENSVSLTLLETGDNQTIPDVVKIWDDLNANFSSFFQYTQLGREITDNSAYLEYSDTSQEGVLSYTYKQALDCNGIFYLTIQASERDNELYSGAIQHMLDSFECKNL